MTPGARLQAVIDLLAEVEATRLPADAVLEAYFRKRRYAGSKDRRAIGETFWETLRRRARLDWWVARAGLEPEPRLRALAATVLDDTDPTGLFTGQGYAPLPLDEAERGLVDSLRDQPLDHPDMPESTRLECPDWLAGRLDAETLGSLNHPAPVDLRVNTAKADRETAQARLAEDGIETTLTPHSPIGLRLAKPRRLGGARAFKAGLVEVQDEGSQLLSLLCDARPGETVIDFCAGGGGKALALAAAMENKGRVIACDVDAKRLGRLDARRERAGASVIETQPLASEADPWVAANAGTADLVLIDAPCSGTGTWRRSPEARWRLTPERLAKLVELQEKILASASRLVAPGRRLVYATCSLLAEENEERVEAFLAAHPDFTLQPKDETGPYLRLSPQATETDGFFAATLLRAT